MSNISIIVAVDLNNAIGKDNNLLCYLPSDLKHFKKVTLGHSIIMGRKTFQSLPNGALPGRNNIVLTKKSQLELDGCIIATSLPDAIDLTRSEKQVFIIGGASVYSKAINIANNLYITRINHAFENADTFFPKVDLNIWEKISEENFSSDEKNKYEYSFILYQKKLK